MHHEQLLERLPARRFLIRALDGSKGKWFPTLDLLVLGAWCCFVVYYSCRLIRESMIILPGRNKMGGVADTLRDAVLR